MPDAFTNSANGLNLLSDGAGLADELADELHGGVREGRHPGRAELHR